MPNYMHFGDVPKKRHTKLERNKDSSFKHEGIAYEHVVTTAGFNRAYSIMYHLRPPTRIKAVETAGHIEIPVVAERALQHTHLKTASIPRAGDPISGRVPLLTNPDVTCYRCRPEKPQPMLFRNG